MSDFFTVIKDQQSTNIDIVLKLFFQNAVQLLILQIKPLLLCCHQHMGQSHTCIKEIKILLGLISQFPGFLTNRWIRSSEDTNLQG